MIDSFFGVLKVIWLFLQWPLYAVLFLLFCFALLVAADVLYLRYVAKVPRRYGEHYRIKAKGFCRRIFLDAPMRLAKDLLARDPEYFKYQGIICFTGAQGNGKTISMVQAGMVMQQEYPKAVCLTNLAYKYADKRMDSWDDLIGFRNPKGDKCGVIVLNDEIQNSFNSKESKNFPMAYVAIATQNRKNRRVILCTAQNFYMLAKDIRSQCTEIRQCTTLLGCITIVNVCVPEIDTNGDVKKLKHRRFYFFVHDDKLRDAYDTYEVIERMAQKGFKPRAAQVSSFSDNNYIVVDKKSFK